MDIFGHYKNVGKIFEKLTITSVFKGSPHFYYSYKCECGKTGNAIANKIITGHTKSCGCNKPIVSAENCRKRFTHKMTKTSEYKAYHSAKTRCESKKYTSYKNYGGRGIKFLFTSFEEFYYHIGPKPSDEYQLDRIDNDGNYEPGNVRWATPQENVNNRRCTLVK